MSKKVYVKPYPKEFREQVVKLVQLGDRSAASGAGNPRRTSPNISRAPGARSICSTLSPRCNFTTTSRNGSPPTRHACCRRSGLSNRRSAASSRCRAIPTRARRRPCAVGESSRSGPPCGASPGSISPASTASVPARRRPSSPKSASTCPPSPRKALHQLVAPVPANRRLRGQAPAPEEVQRHRRHRVKAGDPDLPHAALRTGLRRYRRERLRSPVPTPAPRQPHRRSQIPRLSTCRAASRAIRSSCLRFVACSPFRRLIVRFPQRNRGCFRPE